MAITAETLRLATDQRAAVDATVSDLVRQLVGQWARSWDLLYGPWYDAAVELVAAGGRPSQWQLARNVEAQRALAATDRDLRRLVDVADRAISSTVPSVVSTAAAAQNPILASQLPPDQGGLSALSGLAVSMFVGQLAVPNLAAGAAVAASVVARIGRMLGPLPDDVMLQLPRVLLGGVPVGVGPAAERAAVNLLLQRLEAVHSAGLARALTITRTDLHDAARAAAAAQHDANRKHLLGWRWVSRLDVLTCPSCWVRHGTLHRLDVPGPLDHPNGRCVRVPQLRSWRALGIATPEPPSVLPDGEASFWSLPDDMQLRIMGARRLALLRSGLVQWADLTKRRGGPGWRASYGVRPVRDLERIAAQRAAA